MPAQPRKAPAKKAAAPAVSEVSVKLAFTSEHKYVYRFDTDDKDAAVKTLYVNKAVFGSRNLEKEAEKGDVTIEVTIKG